jgi:LytS/YehU family sensor histidine kinase
MASFNIRSLSLVLICLLFPWIVSAKENDSLEVMFKHLSDTEVIDTLNYYGKLAFNNQHFVESARYFEKALDLAKKTGNISLQAKMHNNVGIIEDTKGEYTHALEHYKDALKYYELNNDKDGIEKVYNNIGIVYEELKMFDKALGYFKNSLQLKVNKKKKNYLSIAGTYNNIAIIYENYLLESDSALNYYRLALANYNKADYFDGRGKVCSNIGLLYFRQKKYMKADSCFNAAFSVFSKSNNKSGIASVLYYKANLQMENESLEKALHYLKQALNISLKLQLNNLRKNILKAYSLAYEKQHKPDSALVYYKKYQKLSEELLNIKKLEKVKTLEQKMDIDHKNFEINLLKKDKEISDLRQTRQNILIVALLILLISLAIIFHQQAHRKKIQTEIELRKAKTRLLRSQMSPHFIFNSLMSIQSFLIEGDVKGASKYLTLLARMMRLLLTYSRESYISVDQEIEVTEYYLATEKLRFGDKLEYLIEVDNSIDKCNTFIPPLMIQPALENAIVHGIMPCKEKGKLTICFKTIGTNLVVEIEDNGVGYKAAKSSENSNRKSFSTNIIKERIQLIKSQFNQQITYKIEEADKNNTPCPGTRVTFIFPLDY